MTEREHDLDMDQIVDLLKGADVPAYVEQTGGGCATIYAGQRAGLAAHTDPEQQRLHGERQELWAGYWGPACDGSCERFEVVAGPGVFDGPGWTLPRATTAEFFIGPDDEGQGEYVEATDEWDEARAAAEIVRQIKEAKR